MYKLLIVTTLFSPGGENIAISSVIAEFTNTSQADAAYKVIEARGNTAINGCSIVEAMKLYQS